MINVVRKTGVWTPSLSMTGNTSVLNAAQLSSISITRTVYVSGALRMLTRFARSTPDARAAGFVNLS